MADIDTIGPGPYPNVLDIPTPPLQRTGIFVMFVFPAIATVVFGLRVYTRVSMHTVGVGRFPLSCVRGCSTQLQPSAQHTDMRTCRRLALRIGSGVRDTGVVDLVYV